MSIEDDILSQALTYARMGFAVLPVHRPIMEAGARVCACGKLHCASPAKHPVGRLVPRGALQASKDPRQVTEWFAGTRHNIGIATGAVSNLIVLDIDPRHGGDATLACFERLQGKLPPTVRFKTGGGGQHILFRHPGGYIPNSAGKIGPGVDVRGDGGYIVAPPSEHISGGHYEVDSRFCFDITTIADMPEILKGVVILPSRKSRRRKSNAANPSAWREALSGQVIEGQRNESIARLAGLLLGRGLDPHVSLDILLAYNDARLAPPLNSYEVIATVASIASREGRERKRREDGGG